MDWHSGTAPATPHAPARASLSVLCAMLAAPVPLHAEAQQRSFTIDSDHSVIGFEVPLAGGLTRVRGTFTDFEGEILYDLGDPSASSVHVLIRAASVDTGNDQRDDHLRHADFFDAETWPEIEFDSERIEPLSEGGVVVGTLGLKGRSHEIQLPFRRLHSAPVEDVLGTATLGFEARIRVNRHDFGLTANARWNRPLEAAGERMMSDSVDIVLNVIAEERQPTPASTSASAAEQRRDAVTPELGFPAGLALDPVGNVLIADRRANRVFSLDLDTKVLHPVAGTGTPGFSGDGGPATEAELQHPDWVAVAPDGDVLIADTRNHRIRRVDRETGIITTIAGTGENRSSGDGGAAVSSSLTNPYGLAVGPDGDIYVFDTETHVIRRIDADSGIIDRVVGSEVAGFGGDGGSGREARLHRPHNGTWTADGRLVFGDSFNQRIRSWDPATDRVETIAGTGIEGTSPEGTPAERAHFTFFGALLEEADGSLVYTGLEGRVMRIRASDGRLEQLADGLDTPYGLVRLADGDLLVAEAGGGRLVRIDGESGEAEPLDLGTD